MSIPTQRYYQLTECNEEEDEVWHFYIPEAGNMRALQKLAYFVSQPQNLFVMNKDPLTEFQIFTLQKYTLNDTTKFDKHTKLTGFLNDTSITSLDSIKGGRIVHLMQNTPCRY